VRRVRAYIGLGANLGEAAETIAKGIRTLAVLPGVRLHGVSRLYVTRPVGVEDQPPFRNAVVALDVPAGPDRQTGAIALLVALKGLERAFGRQERERWGPRELDLDLLLFGRARLTIDRPPEGVSLDAGKADRLLVVPHPEAADRLFVLAPLADIASRLVPPGWKETVATAAARRRSVEGAEAADRLFVLAPLADIASRLVPPGWKETVATAAARRRSVEGEDAAMPIAAWDADREGWQPIAPT